MAVRNMHSPAGVLVMAQAAAVRPLNTAFQVDVDSPAFVTYSVQCTVTASISGGQNGDVILEVASDQAFTQNVQALSMAGLGQTYTLAVALQGVQPQTALVSGWVPPGYWVRIRTVNNVGVPVYSFRGGQEVVFG